MDTKQTNSINLKERWDSDTVPEKMAVIGAGLAIGALIVPLPAAVAITAKIAATICFLPMAYKFISPLKNENEENNEKPELTENTVTEPDGAGQEPTPPL